MKIENWRKRVGSLVTSLWLAITWAAPVVSAAEPKPPRPLPQAHAHNDYEHARPLLDALDHGFCSVEADIWLVDGQLLVAHDLKDVKPERTLQALYLEPLRERVARNGGRVFRDGPVFTLLIDVKSEATNTYAALREVLNRFQGTLTKFTQTETFTNAVTIVISGNRARGLMAAEKTRLAAYDGRLADLDSSDPPHLIPLISDNWTLHFKWLARADEGPLPEVERAKLRQLVGRAHEQGRRVRFWSAPDQPAAWQELFDARLDYINTDDLVGLEKFLESQTRK